MELFFALLLIGMMVLAALLGGKGKTSDHPETPQKKLEEPVPQTDLKYDQNTLVKRTALSNASIRQVLMDLPKMDVVAIIDGDTVVVSGWWTKLKIRLDSIDCPEDGQYWGDIAKYGLIKLIGGKSVRLEEHGLDVYGRTLATIYVWQDQKHEWLNVNERMVMLGHAWVMRRYYDHLPPDRQKQLNRLERWAKSKKVGLWKDPKPVPPWNWRRQQQ